MWLNPTRLIGLGLIGLALTACAPGAVPSPLSRDLPWPFSSPEAHSGETTPDDTVRAAIQLVIIRGNFEQEQAIATRDPAIMRESATNSHFQELARTNQSLLDGGITKVRLDALEWGPITVTESAATATSYETWTAIRADGTTQQSCDRNVYRLVKRDGVWKVQSNDHPDSDGAGAPSPPERRDSPPGPGDRRDPPQLVPRGQQA